MADANQEIGAAGIGYGGTPPGGISGPHGASLRAEIDAVLRRHGVERSFDSLGGMPGMAGPHMGVLQLVRPEDHQRLNAPNRETMRREALDSVGRYPLGDSFSWTEQSRAAFLAFIMKGTLPGPGNSWVLPYASWGEAQASYASLYANAAKWDEWWREVQ